MTATCVFCAIIRGEQPDVIILETERLIAFLDHRPLFYGHTLLVPKQHMVLLSDLPADQVPEFFGTAQRLERAVEDGLPSDGSMILINNVISQSVPHLHLHVIPRFDDEPMIEHGIRSGIKDPANRRPDPWRPGTGRHMAGS